MMLRGYGRTVLSNLRSVDTLLSGSQYTSSYPRVLGRDFSGEVVAVARNVSRVRPGDQVWGALYPSHEGSHQQFCIAQENCVGLKPRK